MLLGLFIDNGSRVYPRPSTRFWKFSIGIKKESHAMNTCYLVLHGEK